MKSRILNVLILLSVAVFAGCSTNVTMTGKRYAPVQPLEVKILFKDKPKCNYEELGFISTPLSWDQNIAVEKARKKAAEIGADYLVIEAVHSNAYNDVSVSGVAVKCGIVDRESIEVRAN